MSGALSKREEWLLDISTSAYSWHDLSELPGFNGQNLQTFWRTDRRTGRPLSDEEMFERGILQEAANGRVYHSAYIPWLFLDPSLQKKDWPEDKWVIFRNQLGEIIRSNNSAVRSIYWEKLTIPSDLAEEFVKSDFQKNHLIGSIGINNLNPARFRDNLIDGDLQGQLNNVENLIVNGNLSSVNRPLRISNSHFNKVKWIGERGKNFGLSIDGSKIETLEVASFAPEIVIENSQIDELICEDVEIGKFSIIGGDGDYVSLQLKDSIFKGRFFLSGLEVRDTFADRRRSFEHAKFHEKVRVINCDIPLSVFADIQLEAPIDVDFDDSNPEDVFEAELVKIRTQIKKDTRSGEEWRRRLERACQLICDRHRQDGRRDMEHRYRRMELKARAYRVGADPDTKVLTWAYEFFSDFGRSFVRPIRGLMLIWCLFFLCYWALGALALDLELFRPSGLKLDVLADAALLSSDKTFPFGTSVEESSLFSSRLLGAEGGGFAIVSGLLGAFQVVLSGIMIFLCGLSVRTKLLIG